MAINTINVRAVGLLLVGVLLLSLGGCASGPSPTLERLRADYGQVRQDPDINTHAPTALREAGDTLSRAERVWSEDGDAEELEHLAYVTEQRIAIARAKTEQKLAQAEIAKLGGARDQVLLDARSRDAQQAALKAEQAALEAEQARQRAQQLEQQLEEFKARETERGLLLTLGDVLFEVGRADLKPGIQRKLFPLAAFLKENPNRNVLIEGHTDSTGSDTTNQRLSEDRATAVANFLMAQGVNPARITTTGYGEVYPVATNDTAAGRQQNRRVDVVILREGESAAGKMRR